MTKYKILCALLATGLAVSLSRETKVRELYRKYSTRIRRRARALADAWTRSVEFPDQDNGQDSGTGRGGDRT